MKKTLKTILASILALTLLVSMAIPCFATETAAITYTKTSEIFLSGKNFYTFHAGKGTPTLLSSENTTIDNLWHGAFTFQSSSNAHDGWGYKSMNSKYYMLWDADNLYILWDKVNNNNAVARFNIIADQTFPTSGDALKYCFVDVEVLGSAGSRTVGAYYSENTITADGTATLGTLAATDKITTSIVEGDNSIVGAFTVEIVIPWNMIYGSTEKVTVDVNDPPVLGIGFGYYTTTAGPSTVAYTEKTTMSDTKGWTPLALGKNDVIEPDISWYSEDDADGIFELSDAADLYGFSYLIRSRAKGSSATNAQNVIKEMTSGKTFKLTADIDLNPGWSYDTATKNTNIPSNFWLGVPFFHGIFDGQGHTVYDMYNNGSAVWMTIIQVGTVLNKQSTGFMGEIKGELKNIAFVDGWINTGNNTSIGTLGSSANDGCTLIENIFSNVDISNETPTAGASSSRVGGLLGGTYDSDGNLTLRNLVYVGNITTDYTLNSDGEIKGTPTGGLIGRHNSQAPMLTMTDCVFAGTITEGAKKDATNELIGDCGAGKLAKAFERCFAVVVADDMTYSKDTETGKITDRLETTSDNIIEVEKADLTVENIPNITEYNVGADDLINKWTYDKTYGVIMPMTVVEMNTDIHAQRTASVGGKTSVRILATVDALNFTEVGFRITMTYNGVTKNIDATAESEGTGITVTKKVWSSVQANGDTVSADVLGGKYIYGVVINNVPDTGVIFNVTSYKTALNGASVEGVSTVTLNVADIPAPTAN